MSGLPKPACPSAHPKCYSYTSAHLHLAGRLPYTLVRGWTLDVECWTFGSRIAAHSHRSAFSENVTLAPCGFSFQSVTNQIPESLPLTPNVTVTLCPTMRLAWCPGHPVPGFYHPHQLPRRSTVPLISTYSLIPGTPPSHGLKAGVASPKARPALQARHTNLDQGSRFQKLQLISPGFT